MVIRWLMLNRWNRHEVEHYLGVQHRQHRLEKVAAVGRAIMDQQHPIDADPRLPQLRDRSGLSFADLGDAAAALQVEMHIPICTQDADGQPLRLPPMQTAPVQGDLVQLLLGPPGLPHDQLLGLDVLGRLHYGMQRVVCWQDERNDTRARAFGLLDHGGHQLLVAAAQIPKRGVRLAWRLHDLGGHDDDVRNVGVGLSQSLLQHRQVIGRANGDQLPVGLGQAKAFRGDLPSRLLVELLEVFVLLPAPPLLGEVVRHEKDGQKRPGEN